MATLDASGPIEVWLTQKNMEITCMVVYEDESTGGVDVDSLSLRGAQREITGWVVHRGYTPVGRWEPTAEDPEEGDAIEVTRRFKPAKTAKNP
jgi:hypothetical protein